MWVCVGVSRRPVAGLPARATGERFAEHVSRRKSLQHFTVKIIAAFYGENHNSILRCKSLQHFTTQIINSAAVTLTVVGLPVPRRRDQTPDHGRRLIVCAAGLVTVQSRSVHDEVTVKIRRSRCSHGEDIAVTVKSRRCVRACACVFGCACGCVDVFVRALVRVCACVCARALVSGSAGCDPARARAHVMLLMP